ncbi:MAG: hypothetical protein ACI86M_000138 [Saprospiraceae bacterium]|jgi:hypothetical protein
MNSKLGFVFIFLSLTSTLFSQRFTFAPEVGIAYSQIDGDWLQGFDKTGSLFGLGTNYFINDKFSLAFNAKYMNLGSGNGGKKQNKPSGAIQFISSFSSASIGAGFMVVPFNSKLRIGGGINYNRVVDFSYNTLVQLTTQSRIIIDKDKLRTNYLAYNLSAHINIFQNVYANISFYKSINNLLEDAESSDIKSVVPYYLTYSLFYEFDPNPKRKRAKGKKKRGIN